MNCPLCQSKSIAVEDIDISLLSNLWKGCKVDISGLIKSKQMHKMKCLNCGLVFFDPPTAGDANFYNSLAQWDWYYQHEDKSEYPYVAKMIRSGMRVLDVGSGMGEFQKHLEPGVEYIGVELSETAVNKAKNNGIDVRAIPLGEMAASYPEYFDCVVCFQVLEHVVEINEMFGQIIAACKPGGLIAIAVPNNDAFLGYASNNYLNLPPHHVLQWNRSSLDCLGEKFGLQVVETLEEKVTPVHWEWYLQVRVYKILCDLFQLKIQSVEKSDNGYIRGVLRKLTDRVTRYDFLFSRWKNCPGHTIIYVFRKKGNA